MSNWIDIPQPTSPKRRSARSLERQANQLLYSRPKREKGKRRKIPRMSYRVYMQSHFWRKRKNRYFSKHGKRCAVCSKKYGVTLHHKIYDSQLFGREPDSHLVALCGKHHHEFHENHKTKQNMATDTDLYVLTARGVHSSQIDDLSWI